MRVLYLINYAGKAGIEKYVENLVRLLPEEGVTPFFAYNIPGELSEKMEARGVKSPRLNLNWVNAPRAVKELAHFCRKLSIEVIHAQGPRENILALLAARRCPGVRVVYTEHFTRRCGRVWHALYRHFTPQNHKVIAVCPEAKEVLIANGCAPYKIRVVYNGVIPARSARRREPFRQEMGLDDRTFLISCLARLQPEKGLDFLIRSLETLQSITTRPFCCVVAGDGPLEEELRSEAEAAGLGNRFRLLGYRTDTGDILGASDLYVCSSKCNEAHSFAILEAMNAGLPLVVTDVGGNRDMAEGGGICGKTVPYGDEAGFARAVRELMEDEEKRKSWSAAARKKIEERFDLNRLSTQVYECYLNRGGTKHDRQKRTNRR